MTYGVQSTGFVRKPLSVILAEIEEGNIATFGPEIIQTPQSPLGQINGLMAEILAIEWETAENIYQSFDVDQAESLRQNTIAKLRRMTRGDGETDNAFRLRITNEAQADIKLIANMNRLRAIDGVTWVSARENVLDATDDKGQPAHSVAYAVVGGDDEEVGAMVYAMSIPGVRNYGNTTVSVTVDGYCQQATFIRPVDVPIRVEVDVRHIPDACNCAPPDIGTLRDYIIAAFAGDCGYRNGDTVTEDRVTAETAAYGNLKIIETRIARQSTLIVTEEIETTLFERPVIVAPYVIVRYV